MGTGTFLCARQNLLRAQTTKKDAWQHGDSLRFTFTGKVAGDGMSGSPDMREYLPAEWTAVRHQYRSR